MSGRWGRWLLIGSSRWHWAELTDGTLRTWHASPPPADPPPGPAPKPWAWAAVGPVPQDCSLPLDRRLVSQDVPLAGVPPWLGVDRALAGWQAWRTGAGPVLVADAGTVMSLTRVDGNGRFTGGRLQAGVLLQTRAMVTATVSLPGSPTASPGPSTAAGDGLPAWQRWPSRTRAAMEVGVRAGLAAAVATAAREAAALEAGCRLVLTGGDGPLLWTMIRGDLEGSGISCDHRPDLCLEAMVGLRPLA